MQAIVHDLLTSYDKSGKGPVILMLHGWGDSKATFKDLSQALGKDFTVIAPDLPGFGQSQAPPAVWNLDNYATFVRDFLDKLELKPRAIVAHSNGGAVAIRGLAQDAFQADKLVLLASAGIRDRQKLRRLGLKVIAKTGKAATFWLPATHKKKLQKKLYGAAGSDLLVVPHLQETFKVTVRQDVQEDARTLKLPTLLIYGSDDKATPPLYGEAYQQLISGSQLLVLEGAGHFVHHDQLQKVATLIQGFLK